MELMLQNKLSLVEIDEDGVCIDSYLLADGFLVSASERRTLVSDFEGEVTIQTLLDNYANPQKKEWAYQVNDDWYLVYFQSNL